MSEFSPTPGPWKVEAPGLADEGTRAILSPSGDCLARLSAGGNGPHLASNAALMAAAPELLEACQWALNTLRDAVACPDGCPEDLEASLVSAIAKAKGRA